MACLNMKYFEYYSSTTDQTGACCFIKCKENTNNKLIKQADFKKIGYSKYLICPSTYYDQIYCGKINSLSRINQRIIRATNLKTTTLEVGTELIDQFKLGISNKNRILCNYKVTYPSTAIAGDMI